MPLFSLLALALWTFVVVCVLGARATLRSRTFATFLVLGALMAVVILPIVSKVFAPYGERGTLLNVLLAIGWQLALLAPVLSFLLAHRTDRMLSVADAFLLAFMVGFGADLVGGILAAAVAPQPLDALTPFPPWVYVIPTPAHAIAGYGYWTGLVALAVVAMRRFARPASAAAIVGVVVFLWVALAHAASLEVVRTGKLPTGLLGLCYRLTGNGGLPAWVALLALVALSVAESVWEGRAIAGSPPRTSPPFLEDWRALLSVLGRGRVRDYLRLRALLGLRWQARLAHAALRAAPDDAVLGYETARLDARLQEAEAAYATPIYDPPPRRMALMLIEEAAPWVALLFIVGVVPRRGSGAVMAFWDFPLFRLELPSLPFTLLNAFLVGVIVWRYLSAAGRPESPDDPDDTARFSGETTILQVALTLALLAALAVDFMGLYPFPTVIGNLNREKLPPLTGVQLVTLALLLATAATGLTRDRSLRWRAAPVTERRAVGVHNALVVAALFAVTFVNRAVYLPGLRELHRRYGQQLFNFGKHLNGVGLDGNSAAAFLVAIFTGLIGVGVFLLLRWLIRRAEDFLVGPTVA